MNKINHFFVIVSFFSLISCKPNPTEQAILDYSQTLGNSKLDLKMKILSIEKVGEMIASDSAKLVKESFYSGLSDEDKKISIDTILVKADYNIKGWERYIVELDSAVKAMELKKMTDDLEYTFKKSRILKYTEDVNNFKKAYKSGDSINTLLKKYNDNPNRVIGIKYKCTYTIQNPMLNNALQEITKTFVLSLDNKVISEYN
jgi:hypothetical protein